MSAAPFPIPWQVHLTLGNVKCGGTILDSETILTAAHCIPKWPKTLDPEYFVKAGITDAYCSEKARQALFCI